MSRHTFDNLSTTQFIILVAVLVGIIALASTFSSKAIVRRRLKKGTLRRLADFKSGETGKVVGIVEFVDEPLEAPLSGRECAWYNVHILERGNKSAHTIVQEQRKVRFVLRDGDKVAYIDSDYIESYVVEDQEYNSGTFNDATERLENYLRQHGQKSEGFLGMNKGIRYVEGVLEKGESVAILGEGHWRDAESVGLPKEYGMVLAITPADGKPVYLSDDTETVAMHGE
ncbi:hypothetical protein AM493_03615 [Flavobacterium akiainvivens]|uniref:RING-type E3 ubiquitin transferase n=1 Tax=Flavobacterium akiainvivens TaxID=1202724 RepID=A0A0M8M9C1_9FLAO|nr:hypothetical protein [Flavobacterium akiainvivens]KOS05225.1 hypothetical protein AM493_03615 [Flavobacterium akiainvivens]SFQ50457.1 hypothetical protein SAMN05444144_10680 [Flavobacterium akiainvivens]